MPYGQKRFYIDMNNIVLNLYKLYLGVYCAVTESMQ